MGDDFKNAGSAIYNHACQVRQNLASERRGAIMKIGLLISVPGLALCAGVSALAGQTLAPFGIHAVAQVLWSPTTNTKLDNQNNDDYGKAVLSENFTDGAFTTYNSYGADDFVIPSGHSWDIREVDVTGTFINGSGPATAENLLFYKDAKGLPGSLVAECDSSRSRRRGVPSPSPYPGRARPLQGR